MSLVKQAQEIIENGEQINFAKNGNEEYLMFEMKDSSVYELVYKDDILVKIDKH